MEIELDSAGAAPSLDGTGPNSTGIGRIPCSLGRKWAEFGRFQADKEFCAAWVDIGPGLARAWPELDLSVGVGRLIRLMVINTMGKEADPR